MIHANRVLVIALIAALIGIPPVFAQDNTIDLGQVSDDDLARAIDEAGGVQLINRDEAPSAGRTGRPLAAEDTPQAEIIMIAEETPEEEVVIIVEETPEEEVVIIVEETPEEEVIIIVEETPDEEVIIIVEETPEETDAIVIVEETPAADQPVPDGVRSNRYFLESQRFAKLAEEAYNYGDYDASSTFAQESIRNARLSDEYVARFLRGESPAAIIAALEASEAERIRREEEERASAVAAAGDSAPPPPPAPQLRDGTLPLPARYVVRAWGDVRDCFWNIAGRPWVYGNPRQWRVLYEANKHKLADPNDPNVIEPGLVLDIPSIRGESREGTWDANASYEPIR